MQWSKPTARESSFLLLWLWLLPPRNPVYTQWEDSSQERTSVVLDAGRVSGRLGPNIAGTTAPPPQTLGFEGIRYLRNTYYMGFCAQSKSVERGLTRRSYLTLNDECPSNNKLLLRPHRQQGSFSGRQGHIQEAANNSSLLHARTQFLVLEPRPGYGNSSNNACTWRAFAHFDARASQGSKAGRLRASETSPTTSSGRSIIEESAHGSDSAVG